jgi:ADP-heptose:LPS heptosyltransferase
VDVVLVRAGALGDVLLLRSAVAGLRMAGHRVRLVAPAGPGPALVGPGPSEVEALLPWDGPETAAILAGEAVSGPLGRALAGADAVLAYTRSNDVAAALGRVARRVIAYDPSPPPIGPHASAWLGRALEPIGIEAAPNPPPLQFTHGEQEEAARRTASLPPRFLAVHPGSGSPAKNWPAERFGELAARAAGSRPYLLCTGPAEIDHGLDARLPKTACVARGWPVRVLGAALARAGLYVGNDSGVSHLAAATGAPTLALFGPTEPALWSPVGRGARTLRAPDGRIESLSVDDVLREARSLLGDGAPEA